MQPNNLTTEDGTVLDPKVLKVVRALRQTESGGDYNAIGDGGQSHGAYQWNKDNFKNAAKQILGDENAPMTPANQNKVAYYQVKAYKDAGRTPEEIAALWNGAHKDSNTGMYTYNNPEYGNKFRKAIMGQNPTPNITSDSNNSNVSQETSGDNRDLLQKTGDVVNAIFPGKQVGESIGTLGGLAYEKLKGLFGGQDNSKYYDTSAPTPLQTIGDVAQGALMVGTGLPEAGATTEVGKLTLGGAKSLLPEASTAIGRTGQAGLIGAGLGATGAIKEGSTNLGDIGKQTAIGGITGGILGTAGETVSKVAQNLPEWLTRKFITGKGIGNEEIKYAINKGLGSPKTMLSQSNSSIDTLGNQLGSILTNPQYADFTVPGRDILNKVTQDFPDAGLSRIDVVKKLQSIVPLKANLITDLLKGNLSLDELHTLNSALGKNTFKSVFDGTEVKANKEIGSAVYHTISDIIKNVAPESVPIFDSLSKEYPLNTALQGLIRRNETGKSITLKEIMTFLGGSTFGGIPGGLSAVAAEKLATNPTINLKTAGLLSKLAKPTAQTIGKSVRVPLMKTLIDKINH